MTACLGGSDAAPIVTVVDDGERVARDAARAGPPSVWPDGAPVVLFALRGETVAFQVVVEACDRDVDGIHATLGTFADGAARLDVATAVFAERFVDVLRPSGNDFAPGSLAFTADAAPDVRETTGAIADPLVSAEDARAAAHQRGALWIDVTVDPSARPGVYRSAVHVAAHGAQLQAREIVLRVLPEVLPYAPAPAIIYYEPRTLTNRMGDLAAEPDLRALFHAHRLSAIREITGDAELERELPYLRGDAFDRARGYEGPGAGIGERILALGTYGMLGAPTPEAVAFVGRVVARLRAEHLLEKTPTFVYAADEQCESPLVGAWRRALRTVDLDGAVSVGLTCWKDPVTRAADIVVQTPTDASPWRMRVARAAGKQTWLYNGQRPFSGPLALDVPVTDLRANGWIAARYDVERWFYWESTYWFDDNRGGRGGALGFDPYVVAETFHNADGDHVDGDGLLVYPGTQRAPGMTDLGRATVFPSVRLKNLRRGLEDAGYVALARAVDADAADAVVRRTIPRALTGAGPRAAWPERGGAWVAARAELAAILLGASGARGHERDVAPPPDGRAPIARGCGFSGDPRGSRVGTGGTSAIALAFAAMMRRRRIRRTLGK